MIIVTIYQDSDKVYRGIELDGHAGYGEYGQDVLCAAVSALVLNMANSVETFTDDKFNGTMEDEAGRFTFHFTSAISLESKLLMDSLVLGIKTIRSEYGAQYIKIRFKEV